MNNWANTVDAEIANTVVTIASSNSTVTHRDCDNIPTSVRHPKWMKMYAELKRTKKLKKRGIKSLRDNKLIPMIVDAHQAASHLMFINEKYLHLFIHKDEDFRFEDFVKPVNQNVKVGKVYFMGALGSSNNRMHAVLSALTA